jgi:hypothetical protein
LTLVSVKSILPQADKDRYDELVGNGKIAAPSRLIVNVVDGLARLATSVYGGEELDRYSSGTPFATTGFSVHSSGAGKDGVLTAGHVGVMTVYHSGQALAYQSGCFGWSYDVQWHWASGVSFPNKFQWWDDGSTFDVTATRSRDQQNVGDIVSKYGITTHYTCGELISKTAYNNVPYSSATWMLVENIYGYDRLADAGDSGGPWFNGNTALGITSAVSQDYQYAYYMAINYIDILGLTVKTQ